MKRNDPQTVIWFSTGLRRSRERIGKSQELVARESGVTRNAYMLWEQGKTLPSLVNLHRLAKAMEWSKPELRKAVEVIHPEAMELLGNLDEDEEATRLAV